MCTLSMLHQAEAQRIAGDLDPDMAQRISCSPFEQDHRIVLFKTTSPLEEIFINALQHLRQPAFAQDMPGILAYRLTPGFALLCIQRIALWLYLSIFLTRSDHPLSMTPSQVS